MSSAANNFSKTNHREIAVRYAWNARQQKFRRGSPRLIARVRMREIERLFAYRYGDRLPDDDAGLDDLELAAHHITHLDGNAEEHILRWAWEWAPWLWYRDDIKPEEFAHRIAQNPRRYKADTLAWRLRLTKEERGILGITTIGAIDFNKQQRADLRKKKKRWQQAARRRAAGAKSHADSDAQKRPWETMGMSRSKWYSLGKPTPAKPVPAARPVGLNRGQQTVVDTVVDTKQSKRSVSLLGKIGLPVERALGRSSFNLDWPVDWIGRTEKLASPTYRLEVA